MAVEEGDVVVIALPRFDSGGTSKRRPCLVLTLLPGRFQQVLVCGISSAVDDVVQGWDELILVEGPEFQRSGLVRASSVRLSYLHAVHQQDIVGRIGDVSDSLVARLRSRLATRLTGIASTG